MTWIKKQKLKNICHCRYAITIYCISAEYINLTVTDVLKTELRQHNYNR